MLSPWESQSIIEALIKAYNHGKRKMNDNKPHPGEQLEAALADKILPWTDFYDSLLSQYRRKGDLSDKQCACIERALDKALNPKPAETEDLGDFSRVIELFDTAKRHLKYPKIRLTAGGEPLVLSVAGERAKRPGTINVTNGGPFGDNKWYGRITREGELEKSRATTDEVIAVLKALAKDPAKTAEMYGKLHNNCCFCARDLSDPRSVAAGYGPVCADHFGLTGEWKIGAGRYAA